MTDKEIVSLYLERNENAISETERKYDAYLIKTAYNILYDLEDSKEKVNDTYFRAWNIIPPNKPERLSAFLAKITRELSIDEYRRKHSEKRKATGYALALDEIGECIPSGASPEKEAELKVLCEKVNEFILSLPEEQRNIFVCRYFFFDSVKDISSYYGFGESKVKSVLFRLRNKLKEYLEREELLK